MPKNGVEYLAQHPGWKTRKKARKTVAVSFTEEEKAAILTRLRLAAVALAELWDTLREVETEHAISLEIDDDLIPGLAGECNVVPSPDDFPGDYLWEVFLGNSTVGKP